MVPFVDGLGNEQSLDGVSTNLFPHLISLGYDPGNKAFMGVVSVTWVMI